MEATMNKKTKALTTEQYKEIIQTMREGFSGCRPNERIATALVLEGSHRPCAGREFRLAYQRYIEAAAL